MLASSAFAVEEARRNLASRHHARLIDLERLMQTVEVCAEARPAVLALAASEGLPPKDAPILAASIASRCHILVTGDRTHFGALFGHRVHGSVVMLPVDALQVLVGS